MFSSLAQVLLSGNKAQKVLQEAIEVRYDENDFPSYILFAESSNYTKNNWETAYRKVFDFGPSIRFVLEKEEKDELGFEHFYYKQFYNNTPIAFSRLIVHVKNNHLHAINANYYGNTINVTEASISEEIALDFAKNHMGAELYKWEIPEEELHLKREQKNTNATYFPKGELVYIAEDENLESPLKLAYHFNIYAQEPLMRRELFIDAQNGELLFEQDLIHIINVSGTANTAYSGIRPIVTDSFADGVFRLRETVRGQGVSTFDMNKSTQHSQAVDFIDSNNYWSNFNGFLDQYATDAHWGAEVTYDYFDSIHNRNSIDNNGFALLSYVHYGNNYNNAFWDGQRMTYGDGNGQNSPLTSLDIAGHEIAHGLTNFSAGLIYRKESGALNESFSDIFGAAVEFHGKPSVANWLLGEDIGSPFRSMSNPNGFSDPDTYDGQFWISQNCTPTSGNDWCGVHTNSGVQNYWFYLLSNGGSGVNDRGDTFNVSPIGIINAGKVAFRNLTVYLTQSSNFNDARFYGIKSAIDLFGGCSPEVEAVTNAWYAVGVGPAYTPGVDADFIAPFDSIYCKVPSLVSFSSNSNNVSRFKWEFGDGDTSDLPKPSHLYDSVGVYTVKLYVDGGVCGSDSVIKTAYISVDTNNICSYSMPKNSSQTITDCYGRLYDNGGLNQDYEIRTFDTIILSPSNADWIQLIFDTLQIESGYDGYCNHDYIEIFDGPSADFESMGQFCSSNLPDTIKSTGPHLTLVMHSDDLTSRLGFIAEWSCMTASQIPVAAYSQKFDTTCSGYNYFIAETINGATNFSWSFGDGNTSTLQNPEHTYQQSGVYTVTFSASNSVGNSASISSQVVVNLPALPSVDNDTNCINGKFKLAATGTGSLEWYTASTGGNRVFVGDTLRLNNLSSDTSFYVESFNQQARVIGTPIIISGPGYHSDTTLEVYFDVYKPTLLESAIFNSNRRGERVVLLKDNQGKIIDRRTVNLPDVPSQTTLNFEIPPGTGYSLSIGNRNPSLYVNTSGANYPYNFGNFMSITGNSLNQNYYPFYYYIIARELPCISSRALVEAIVDTSCVLVGIDQNEKISSVWRLYPNPVNDQLTVEVFDDEVLNAIEIYTVQGRLVKNSIESVQKKVISVQDLTEGLYLVKVNTNKGIYSKLFIKQ